MIIMCRCYYVLGGRWKSGKRGKRTGNKGQQGGHSECYPHPHPHPHYDEKGGGRGSGVKPSVSTANNYVLGILAANTHQVLSSSVSISDNQDIHRQHFVVQDRYFNTDLKQGMEHLEMGVYER